MLSREDILAVVSEAYEFKLSQIVEEKPGELLRSISSLVSNLYRYADYSLSNCNWHVVIIDDNDNRLRDDLVIESLNPSSINSFLRDTNRDTLYMTYISGRIYILDGERCEDDIENIIVYVRDELGEYLRVYDNLIEVNAPLNTGKSVFDKEHFVNLREALQRYSNAMVKESTCHIIQSCWHDTNRIVLSNRPEEKMQKSLSNYLRASLREAEVDEEHNTDRTNPVDIRITWMFENRTALIEIKWLGKSVSSSGGFTAYYDQRARDGAQQLANYLDNQQTSTPGRPTKGYLVVIDARRKGVSSPSVSSISCREGLHYLHKDVEYDPPFHELRSDFSEPFRMFAKPICQRNSD